MEHAPGEYLESMLRNVRLNSEIMAAWAEHGKPALSERGESKEKAVGEGEAE